MSEHGWIRAPIKVADETGPDRNRPNSTALRETFLVHRDCFPDVTTVGREGGRASFPIMRMVITAAAALMLFGATPAVAEVSDHCKESGYCLFSGSNFDGTKVSALRIGCRTAQSIGLVAIRSAARGYGDSLALTIYSGTACDGTAVNVFSDTSGVVAKSYQLIPIPS